MSKKEWRRPEVKSISAGSAEGSGNKNTDGKSANGS